MVCLLDGEFFPAPRGRCGTEGVPPVRCRVTLPSILPPLMSGPAVCGLGFLGYTVTPKYMATGQYERSGTRASAHPDPDPHPELRIKSSNFLPDERMQCLKIHIALGVRSMPIPYLFHTRSRPNKVSSAYLPRISCGNQQESVIVQDSRPCGSSVRSRLAGSHSIGTCTWGTWF